MSLHHTLLKHVQSAVGAVNPQWPLDNIAVEQPKDPTHGDYSTNAAMVLAKPAGIAPRMVAEQLVPILQKIDIFEQVTIAGPGFINFTLTPAVLHGEMKRILIDKKAYTHPAPAKSGEQVMVEFVSTNPTGPLHIGHGRNAVVGDVLSNLLTRLGHTVYREYLVNDAGGQIHTLIRSVLARYRELFGQPLELPKGGYGGEYVIDIAHAVKAEFGDKWLNETDYAAQYATLRPFCVGLMMTEIKKDLASLNVVMDNFFSEFDMVQTGAIEKAVAQLEAQNLVYTGTLPPPKGEVVDDYEPVPLKLFKATAFGDDTDRPVYKSNGEHTYFGQDIAYHQNKLSRGWNRLINVWGADHIGANKRIESAVLALAGRPALSTLFIQMVRVFRNGELLKMSKRAGNFITVREVVNEVGTDVVRFWMLTRRADAGFDFDLTKALEKSNENPIFYVQYAHARMASVFRQQAELGLVLEENINYALLTGLHERELIRILSRYTFMLERAGDSLEPHRLAFYAQELAAAFHGWYGAEKFLLPENIPLTTARLALVKASQAILADVLSLMGVGAPEKM